VFFFWWWCRRGSFFVWVDVDAVVSDVSFFLVCDAAAAVTTTLL
jgi:hypothetical protein